MKKIMVVLFALIIVGVGGKVYMDKKIEAKNERLAAELIEAERMSVVALKNTFANIKSIEFEKSGYDEMTGGYTMFVRMTNLENNSVNFSYSFWEEPKEIGSYGVQNRDVQVPGITIDKVQVVYSNQDEGEV